MAGQVDLHELAGGRDAPGERHRRRVERATGGDQRGGGGVGLDEDRDLLGGGLGRRRGEQGEQARDGAVGLGRCHGGGRRRVVVRRDRGDRVRRGARVARAERL